MQRRGAAPLRPEIQALRAVAVGLVVVYHLWPGRIPGGYIGVDVFFVISGFLITQQLVREVDRTGRLSLAGFWAKRARRLLPASLLVLLATAVATLLTVPRIAWEQFLNEVGASAVYLQNWRLAIDAVDYLAAENEPSPVQHYWSLSAEEQFYVLWPLLILVAVVAARRFRGTSWRRLCALVLAAVTVASFAWSVRATAVNPANAYFVTPTRAWEFGVGGLLAVVAATPLATRHLLRSVVSWVGLALIVIGALAFSDATPFPGSAALLPALGSAAIIWAGAPEHRLSPLPLARLRSMQFVGDISYSLYLWHWPLIVLTPFVTNDVLTVRHKIPLVLIAVLLAWGTKVAVEDPVRQGAFLVGRRPRWTFGCSVAATAVVVAVCAVSIIDLRADVAAAGDAEQPITRRNPPCLGAAARDPENQPCVNPELAGLVIPDPVAAENGKNAPCEVVERAGLVRICAFGVPAAAARRTFAVIGDSHAEHIRAALQVVARNKSWRGLSITRSSCPAAMVERQLHDQARRDCVDWNAQVLDWLATHPEVTLVFSAGLSGARIEVPDGTTADEAFVEGYLAQWRATPTSVEQIVVIRDTPGVGKEILGCVSSAMRRRDDPARACAVPRGKSVKFDPAAEAAKRLASPRVRTIDLTDFFCDRKLCYPVIGGVLVFRDATHLTRLYSRTLGPYLERDLTAIES